MPNSNQYKLLRTGSVRAGAGAARGGRGGRSGRYRESAHILVPDIEEFGHQPFTIEHLQVFTQRMQGPAWPRGALNIFGLEGLITALLALPLGLRPTVWLPLIWNESGWKIPVALQREDQFRESVESIVGFMRAIDADLRERPPRFDTTLETLATHQRPKALAQRDWALGFGLAVSQSNYLNTIPDAVTHRALYAIAMQAHPPSTTIHQRGDGLPLTLQQAVLVLAERRVSRGPLGPFV